MSNFEDEEATYKFDKIWKKYHEKEVKNRLLKIEEEKTRYEIVKQFGGVPKSRKKYDTYKGKIVDELYIAFPSKEKAKEYDNAVNTALKNVTTKDSVVNAEYTMLKNEYIAGKGEYQDKYDNIDYIQEKEYESQMTELKDKARHFELPDKNYIQGETLLNIEEEAFKYEIFLNELQNMPTESILWYIEKRIHNPLLNNPDIFFTSLSELKKRDVKRFNAFINKRKNDIVKIINAVMKYDIPKYTVVQGYTIDEYDLQWKVYNKNMDFLLKLFDHHESIIKSFKPEDCGTDKMWYNSPSNFFKSLFSSLTFGLTYDWKTCVTVSPNEYNKNYRMGFKWE